MINNLIFDLRFKDTNSTLYVSNQIFFPCTFLLNLGTCVIISPTTKIFPQYFSKFCYFVTEFDTNKNIIDLYVGRCKIIFLLFLFVFPHDVINYLKKKKKTTGIRI